MAGIDCPKFEVDDETVIWRFMSVERFRQLLAGELYFASASQFGDPFEGAVTAKESRRRFEALGFSYPAGTEPDTYPSMRAFEDLRRMVKINCWHAAPWENVQMWERYLRDGGGVAVQSTVGALKAALRPFRLKPEYGEEQIRVGQVRYVDYANDEMQDRSMTDVFLHKRIEFSDESEVRAVVSLRVAAEFGVEIPNDGIIVAVDPRELIRGLRCRRTDLDEARSTVAEFGLEMHVDQSSLDAYPTY